MQGRVYGVSEWVLTWSEGGKKNGRNGGKGQKNICTNDLSHYFTANICDAT